MASSLSPLRAEVFLRRGNSVLSVRTGKATESRENPAKCVVDVKRMALRTRKRWFPHWWAQRVPVEPCLCLEAVPGTEPSACSSPDAKISLAVKARHSVPTGDSLPRRVSQRSPQYAALEIPPIAFTRDRDFPAFLPWLRCKTLFQALCKQAVHKH